MNIEETNQTDDEGNFILNVEMTNKEHEKILDLGFEYLLLMGMYNLTRKDVKDILEMNRKVC